MKKRTKYVYSSSQEVYHLWANQVQDSARQGGRLTRSSFQGASCYSYRAEIGRLVEINGHNVALVNTTRYSNTTCKHQSQTSSAASHILQVDVDQSFDWEAGLVNMQGEIIEQLFDILLCRKAWSIDLSYHRNKIEQFNKLCKALGKPELTLNVPKELYQLIQAYLRPLVAKNKAENALAAAKLEADRKERAERAKEKLEAWLKGGDYSYELDAIFPQQVRVNGDKVETTSHASIPVSLAKLALKRLLDGKLKKGTDLGGYSYGGRNGDKVFVGCHTLSLEQITQALKGEKQ